MAFIDLPNGVKVMFRGHVDTLPWSVGAHVVLPGAPTPASVAAIATAARAWVTDGDLPGVLGTDAVIESVEAKDVSVDPGASDIISFSTAGAGVTVSAPSCMAARAVLHVASGTLRKPGALFFPAVPATYIVADILSGAALAAYESAINALLADLTNAGGTLSVPVVASYRLHALPRPHGVAVAIASASIRAKVGTQVRRLRAR